MKPTRDTWAAALQLLDAALDLPPERHADWLAAQPVSGAAVKALLSQLLADRRAVETANFLHARPALPDLPDLRNAEFDVGELVGPYRLMRPLGRGGMAVVWLAERADAAHRRPVALKLPQLDRGQARQISGRFLRERTILSDLTHPNITAVLDAGSDGSQPWLAMEFVDGMPLTQFCEHHRLDLAARLRLFLQVLRAVQHAHAHGVIHRDLKPGNVMVDARQQVKLLDFGVAKLLEAEDGDRDSTLTRLHGQAMTPNYASPEQRQGGSVGTASDIYSLGVMLFELVLGRRPDQIDTVTMPPVGPAAAMAWPAPTRPSKLARDAAGAGLPGIPPDKLARQLTGDIDIIVLKALQPQPADRYATVDAYAEDIERHLSRRPILARPEGTWYRAAKFAARHKVGVGVGSAIAVALSGALATTLWQAGVARAEGERALATKRFLVGLFDNSARQGSGDTPAHEVTGKQLLETGARKLLTEYREPTQLRLELLNLLGELSQQLDLLDQSRALIDEALTLTGQLHGQDDVRYARAQMLAAEVKARSGAFEAAAAQGRQALDGLGRARPQPTAALAQTHILLGNVLDQLQRHAESQSHLEQAVALLKASHSTSDQRSRAPFYLARAFEAKRELAAAEAQYLDGIAQAEQNFGPGSYIAAFGYENYGDLLRQMGRFDEAQRYLRRSLDVYDKVLGPRHMTVGGARFELGMVLAASGQRPEADRTYQSAITLLDDVAGPSQPDLVIYQMGVRVKLLLDMGRLGEARDLYAGIFERWPPGNKARARRIVALGLGSSRLLLAEGDVAGAQVMLDEVDASLRTKPADDLWAGAERIKATARHAELAQAKGDTATARRLLDAALAQPIPARNGDLSTGLDLLSALGRTGPDAATARAALDQFAKVGDEAAYAARDVENQARLDQTLGRLVLRSGDAAAARARLIRAVALRDRIDDEASPWRAEVRLDLAECLLALNQRAEARVLLDQVQQKLPRLPRGTPVAAQLRALRTRG